MPAWVGPRHAVQSERAIMSLPPDRVDRRPWTVGLDMVLFGFAGLSAVWLAYLLLRESIQPNWRALLIVVFWLLVAYLALPRLHRVLTRLYLPGYFIGRARTSDGLLGDPVNLALLGEEPQIHAAMTRSGWTRADEISLDSSMRIVISTLSRRSYPEAPVSPLHLFDRQQDFAYQQEVAGNPAKRHHVRFWKCPDGWMLPGGYAVDWLAAGTYDRSVGLSLMTFQVTHRIAADIDGERDHIVASLTGADPATSVAVIRNFSTGYHSRNGGGDKVVTDGDLPVVDLRAVKGADIRPAAAGDAGRVKPPAPTVFGAAVAALRGLVYLVVALVAVVAPGAEGLIAAGLRVDSSSATAIAFGLAGATDLVLGVATYVGRNWARILLMLSSVNAIVLAFAATLQGEPRPTLGAGLPALALSILALLALTSRRARDYATPARGRAPRSAASLESA
jgi:hypothetical protein